MAETPVQVNPGPAFDVMVLTYNKIELTITCLQALYAHTRTPFHLIVIDDSTDLTPLWLTQFCKDHDNVTYVHSDTWYKTGNQKFRKALEHCKTPFMATVMNSIRVEPDWEAGALQVLNSDPKIGYVGVKCLLPNGLIESASIKMMKWLPCDVGRDHPAHRFSLTYQVDAVQWACGIGRVEALKGNLEDNGFHGHRGWDDIDNCFVLKKMGWKIFYCGAGAVYHQPRATRGNDGAVAAKENKENGELFYKRWGFWEDFIKEQPNGDVHALPNLEVKA